MLKVLHGVKVIGTKLCGEKSNHFKGWCGTSQVRSPSDFDNLGHRY